MKKRRSNNLSVHELQQLTTASKSIGVNHSVSFDESMDRLIQRCINLGLAEITIRHYKNELKVFRYYLEKYNPKAISNIANIQFNDIDKFKQYMLSERQSSHSNINIKLKAMRTYFKVNDMQHMVKLCEYMKTDKFNLEAFTHEEVKMLLDSCNTNTFIGLRDYIIMLVFADTGIRVKELCNLKEHHFNEDKQTLYIEMAKNGYSRFVPISKETANAISILLTINFSKDYIFQSIEGEQLSRVAVQRRVQAAGRRAGITNRRCSPHTFRHYYAKTLVQNGANIFEIQKLLGHSSLEMVRVYVNLFDTEVQKTHSKYSPINNLL